MIYELINKNNMTKYKKEDLNILDIITIDLDPWYERWKVITKNEARLVGKTEIESIDNLSWFTY